METSDTLSSGAYLGSIFHQIVENSLRKGKSNNNGKSSSLSRVHDAGLSNLSSTELELNIDPSYFTSLALVRKLVLRDKEAAANKGLDLLKLLSGCCLDEDPDLQPESGNIAKESYLQIPQVVVISLRSIYDLIRESRISHPILCHKVLKALLDILQNLSPESLLNEPSHVVEPLFELLVEISSKDCDNLDNEECGERLTSIATSCLLSLIIAWGVTPKLLQALAHLITATHALADQEITLPNIMISLQRGVQSMAIGASVVSDWFVNGLQKNTLITSFSLNLDGEIKKFSVASDGPHIYLLTTNGLYKIGTGFGGTTSARVYQHNPKLTSKGTLLYINEKLYLKKYDVDDHNLWVISRDTLFMKEAIELHETIPNSAALFSDGNRLGNVFNTKEDELLASLFDLNEKEMCLASKSYLRLALESLYVVGNSVNEESGAALRQLHFNADEGFSGIVAGKEFTLMTSSSGKVWFQGKASCLGLKAGVNEPANGSESSASVNPWCELPLPRGPSIVRCSTGHDGQHSVLIDENGTAYFVGLARRGEDGDISKHRKQPKSSRPKRFVSMEGRTVVNSACNNGTSALVTKEGELYMFGKDSAYCDANTGRMMGLKEARIVDVALGKAHGIALTDAGLVYSFGINNKGQCGRDGLSIFSPKPPGSASAHCIPSIK